MNWLKNIGISFVISIGFILILTFVLTIFSYFDIINNGLFTFFEVFNLIVSVFIGGFFIGKKHSKKGWLEGIKFGIIFIIILFFISYFIYDISINLKYVLFNIIILVVTMFGGMVGINFRKEKK